LQNNPVKTQYIQFIYQLRVWTNHVHHQPCYRNGQTSMHTVVLALTSQCLTCFVIWKYMGNNDGSPWG